MIELRTAGLIEEKVTKTNVRWFLSVLKAEPNPAGGEMPDQPSDPAPRRALTACYRVTRARTEHLCAPLEPDDYQLQSMPDCSPPKWHLAHTAWFFETFVLAPHVSGFRPYRPQFAYLFNSYYDAVGDRWPRPSRGLLSRPTVAEVYAYRRAVDEQMLALW